ncbi:MAG: DMT family transporter [Synergistales bacterium]|nr:DMT family transporter [Synergistales bacterium]
MSGHKVLAADMWLFVASFCWGFGYVASKDALAVFPALWLNALKFSAAFLILAVCFRKRLRGTTKSEIAAAMAVGLVLFGAFTTQVFGLESTAAGKQAFIIASYVVFVPMLQWLVTRVFPGIRIVTASAFCLTGVALLSLQGQFALGSGDALSIAAALLFALHMLLVGVFSKRHDAVRLAVFQIGITGGLSLMMTPFSAPLPDHISMNALWNLAYLTVFATAFTVLVQNLAQRYTPSTHASLILSTESLFGALGGILLLGEAVSLYLIQGGALILLGVMIARVPFPAATRLRDIRSVLFRRAIGFFPRTSPKV